MDRLHAPVLLEEVRHWLQPISKGVYVDGTLGNGGHARMILEMSGPDGVLVGIERDGRNLTIAREQLKSFQDRVRFVQGDYRDLSRILEGEGIEKVDGILLDIGFSSLHVDDPSRGFSFQQKGPLDMRYDSDQGITAAQIVNSWPESELADLFFYQGEERSARTIAKAIVQTRRKYRFQTTTDLADLISEKLGRRGRIHPATRVFQALRIAVNDELGALEAVLPQIEQVLKPGGRMLIISFHSLEDRIVKRFIKSSELLTSLTKKPVVPSDEEQSQNKRARSAKLRIAERV